MRNELQLSVPLSRDPGVVATRSARNRPRAKQTHSFSVDPLSEDWIDLKLVSAMRLMLAASAFCVIYLDAPEPARHVVLTYAALILYTIQCAIFYVLSIRRSTLIPPIIMPWLDVAWYLGLVALTGGNNNILFNFFFFAILVASLGWGYTAGLYVTIVSAILSTVVSFLSAPSGLELPFGHLMLRAMQLLVLGYLISRWGGFKSNLRKRLKLLKDVTVLSNPRFGIDRTIKAVLESLRTFYDADSCLLLISGNDVESYQSYRVNRGRHSTQGWPTEIGADAAAMFILPFENYAVLHHQAGRARNVLFDVNSRQICAGDAKANEKVAAALETRSYLSVPLRGRQQLIGRLFVAGGPQRYDNAAIDFVAQLMNHVTPLLENIRLVDNLASDAAEQERRRIARDIHDSVIQPYLGLQFGIAGLVQKLESENTDVLNDVKKLLELTEIEMVEMRRYVLGLRAGEERRDFLLPAINRYAARFASVTGINVEVKAHDKLDIKDRLAAELFHIVTEGLSNIRRHAHCNDASIELTCNEDLLLLQIKNRRPVNGGFVFGDEDNNKQPALFTPRSISERAALLGGEARVSVDENNYTVVSVAIPILGI